MATLRLRQVRSANGAHPKQRASLRTLGLGGDRTATETLEGAPNGTTEAAEAAEEPAS